MSVFGGETCEVCGAPLPKHRTRFCSDACMDKAANARLRAQNAGRTRPPLIRPSVCMDCGKSFMGHIKSKRCPDCQLIADRQNDAAHQARKRAGTARKIGESYPCESCGKLYVLQSGRQRWCEDCREEQTRKSRNALSRSWNQAAYADPSKRAQKNSTRKAAPRTETCRWCGKTFAATSKRRSFCSDECRAASQIAYQKQYDKTVRKRKKQESDAQSPS